MSVQLNHLIVHCRDKERSAAFLTEILGLPAPARVGPFAAVDVANGVSIDFMETDGDVVPQHYAFLIEEGEFDATFARILERGLAHWADPARSRPDEIYHRNGGRGVYFEDPDGHFLEVLTAA